MSLGSVCAAANPHDNAQPTAAIRMIRIARLRLADRTNRLVPLQFRIELPGNDVRFGSWLCENARTLGGDRTSYSLKTDFAVKRASALNLENELKNVILAEFRSFAFSHMG
jgi:hypothetical protein